MIKVYELHPLCILFPRMEKFDFESLKADIKENGLRTPITLHDNMVLDGGHRYKACMELGINPIYENYVGDNLVSFVKTANLHRRHLLVSGYAVLVSSLQDWEKAHGHGGDRKSTVNVNSSKSTVETRAKESGASVSTQKKADAVAKASPELAKKVIDGEISLEAATREVAPQLTRKPKPEPVEPTCREETPANVEPTYTELDAAHEQIDALQAIVVSGFMDATPEQKDAAKELIASLQAENKTLLEEVRVVTISRNTLMNENTSLKRYIEKMKSEMKKLKVA